MKAHIVTAAHHAKRIAKHLRQRGILTRKKFLAIATVINVLFLFVIGVNILSFPNTMIGGVQIGLKTKAAVREYLERAYTTPITLVINAQHYELNYEHLGIYMDPDAAIHEVFAPNTAGWPANIKLFVTQLFRPRHVRIPLSVSQEFYEYVAKINENGTKAQDIVYVNQEDKQVTLFTPEMRYMVDTPSFLRDLHAHFGTQNTPLTVALVEAPNVLEAKISVANTKLASVYDSPLTVIVGLNGENQFMTLSETDLRRYTTASVSAETGEVTFAINNDTFLPDLTAALSVYKSSFNPQTAYERVGNGIKNTLTTRYEGGPASSVKVGIDSGPNTEGEIADTYIEVDISQQKLFTFKKGALVKTYRVSTGKDYPTPIGTFKVLNKTGLGFSSIYNVWLPYWMGFEFSKELHAYFGIHELPYFYTGDKKIQRPREFIGAPNTGGCVALDIGDAKEVYQFADIGTPIVIYQ